jgi:hypothetical protein
MMSSSMQFGNKCLVCLDDLHGRSICLCPGACTRYAAMSPIEPSAGTPHLHIRAMRCKICRAALTIESESMCPSCEDRKFLERMQTIRTAKPTRDELREFFAGRCLGASAAGCSGSSTRNVQGTTVDYTVLHFDSFKPASRGLSHYVGASRVRSKLRRYEHVAPQVLNPWATVSAGNESVASYMGSSSHGPYGQGIAASRHAETMLPDLVDESSSSSSSSGTVL